MSGKGEIDEVIADGKRRSADVVMGSISCQLSVVSCRDGRDAFRWVHWMLGRWLIFPFDRCPHSIRKNSKYSRKGLYHERTPSPVGVADAFWRYTSFFVTKQN